MYKQNNLIEAKRMWIPNQNNVVNIVNCDVDDQLIDDLKLINEAIMTTFPVVVAVEICRRYQLVM